MNSGLAIIDTGTHIQMWQIAGAVGDLLTTEPKYCDWCESTPCRAATSPRPSHPSHVPLHQPTTERPKVTNENQY